MDARVELLPVVDECAQGPQPGFIVSPARDGGLVDRLPGLPLARSFHSTADSFGAHARVVPRQAGGRDDPPDYWFGCACQILVIDLDEAIHRQYAPPMVHEPLVAAEICHQFGASGGKRQARMKMSLMDRQRRVHERAAAMDDDCARECHVDQPGPEEIERHLVGYSRRLRRDRAQHTQVVCRRLGEEWSLGSRPRRSAATLGRARSRNATRRRVRPRDA